MAGNFSSLNNVSSTDNSSELLDYCSDCFCPATLETVAPSNFRTFLNTNYILLCTFALIGNTFVILVQIFGKKSPKKLRLYLISLAVSDIISGVVCLPFMYVNFIVGEWVFYDWLCPAIEFVQLLSGFVTSTTLAIIGIERYAGTLYPFSRFHFGLRDKSLVIQCFVWLLGLAYATALNHEVEATKLWYHGIMYDACTYDKGEAAGLTRFKLRTFMIVNLVFTFIIPSIVLTVAYSKMIRKFYHSQGQQTPNGQNGSGTWIEMTEFKNGRPTHRTRIHNKRMKLRISGGNASKIKSIKVVFVIMLCYFVCCTPIKLYQFAIQFDVVMYCTEFQYNLQNYAYIVCHWLAMAHCCINPIIYSFMSQLFRIDLKNILSRIFRTRGICRIFQATSRTRV